MSENNFNIIHKDSSVEQSQQFLFDEIIRKQKEYEESARRAKEEEEKKINAERGHSLLKELDTATKTKSLMKPLSQDEAMARIKAMQEKNAAAKATNILKGPRR